ncbi:FISUMP domain-containing protein [Elizabethkingia anophelis]|uniref:FISUMP domain-containing protein n=1 Tax=Elizabethkingia anophelis TaxID=1117645 RepID=UPI003207CFF7
MKTQYTHLSKAGSLLMAAAFLSLTSCRTSETESNNLAAGTTAQIKVNFMGTAFKDNNSGSGAQASIAGKNLSLGSSKEQSRSVLITPSTAMTVGLSPVSSNGKVSAQAGLKNTMAVVSGDPLTSGVKFRLIAYKTSDGSYQSYQDYTIGQTAPSITLDNGVAYTIVAYSYGTSSLPAITPGETSNISNAQIAYDNLNRDLMYQSQSYTPSSTNTTLNLTLMHQLSQITTNVTTNIGALNNVINAVLTPNFSNGTFALNTGVMGGRTTSAPQSIVFNQNDFPAAVNTTVSAPAVLVNSSTTGNGASFSADVNIDGTTKTINFTNAFDITPGTQNNLNVRLSKCGAWMDAAHTQWKEFMCQNLEATPGIDPFSAEAGNHGAKIQWGRDMTGTNGVYFVSQAYDQNPANTGAIAGWSQTNAANGAWNSGTEANPVKTVNDPCPSGYRVPTKTEWQTVIDNNSVERTNTALWTSSPTNFGSALYITNPQGVRTLMLPVAGSRYNTDGALYDRGNNGRYWSSGEATSNASYLYFSNSSVFVNNSNRAFGFSVRCIAE